MIKFTLVWCITAVTLWLQKARIAFKLMKFETGVLRRRLSFPNMLTPQASLEVQQSTGAARKHAKTVRRRWIGLGIFVVALVLILSLSLTLAGGSSTSSSSEEDPSINTLPHEKTLAVVNQGSLASGVNAFGTKLLDQTDAENQNAAAAIDAIFLSPWGIAHALSMLHEGASPNSEARKQLQKVVFNIENGGGASNSAIRTATNALSNDIISGNNDNLTVSDANSAWVAPSFQLLDSYVSALKEYFLAEAQPLTNATAVNNWIEEATRGKITNLIDDATAAAASLILVNAIYFKGLWQVPFNVGNTMKHPFNLGKKGAADGATTSQIEVPMMYLQEKEGSAVHAARYNTNYSTINKEIECIAVKLNYKNNGEEYYAIAAMPEGAVSTDASGSLVLTSNGVNYLAALSSCRSSIIGLLGNAAAVSSQTAVDTVESGTAGGGEGSSTALNWMSSGGSDFATAKIYLPRFEIDYSTSLAPVLNSESIGLSSIFSPGNFGGIAQDGDLAVSDVLHKVYVKVDEQGTEAAAATGIVMVTSMPLEPPKELIVKFDRPFMFSVVNRKTGLALFVGEVYKPEEWAD